MSSKIFFPSKGVCIYCGERSAPLGDEHVVPLSIGGKHIIQKASCSKCEDITKKFEQDVMRGLWGQARVAYNAPTRRKKERPRSFMLKDLDGKSPSLEVQSQKFPAPMIFYQMATAGILCGADPALDRSKDWLLNCITDDSKLRDFQDKYPGRLVAKFRHVPESYGRMLAKIAYCQAMTALDPSDINPICLPYILGTKRNVSYIVGGCSVNDPPQPNEGYSLTTAQVSADDRTLIIVLVRLIANCDTPTYHVVVGEVAGRENVERVNNKLERVAPSGQGGYDLSNPTAKNQFWLPRVWPVKP